MTQQLTENARSSAPPDSDLYSDDDEMRRLLQARLAMVLMILGGISVFYSATSLLAAVLLEEPAPAPLLATFVVGVILCGPAWRYRTGRRTLTELRWADALTTAGTCWLSSAIVTQVRPATEASVSLQLGVTWILIARTALIPSSGKRTLAICLLALVPAGSVSTWLRVQDLERAPEVSDWLSSAYVSYRGLAITAVLATLASNVIYGLRRRVSEIARVGQYVLHEKLGEGGMGVVYRATHALLRRETAVKLLLPTRITATSIARFEREVKLTAQLTHANTVAIFDYGRTPEGVFYYAMEYLDGGDLERLLAYTGPLPAGRVIWMLEQVCRALCEAHDSGLVHRDIKPSNVLVCERGREGDVAKILDFGLVKDLTAADASISHDEVLAGTPLYMSPESISAPDAVDARSDLYSLGAVAYFLLTGTPPFTGKSIVEICAGHMHQAPQPLSERRSGVPADLEQVILRCLHKDPSARWQDAAQLRAALAGCADAAQWDAARAGAWWEEHRSMFHSHIEAQRHARFVTTELRAAATEPNTAIRIDLERRLRL